jgi:hypothetical protein
VALLTNGHAIDVTPIALELLDAADAAPIEE